MMNGGPISWQSTLGKTQMLSTAESEISSAVKATKTAIHHRLMISELSGQLQQKIRLYEDNSAAISMAGQGIRYVRNAKHFEERLRFLQELVEKNELEFIYLESARQLGDCMTKPLDVEKLKYFRNILMTELTPP